MASIPSSKLILLGLPAWLVLALPLAAQEGADAERLARLEEQLGRIEKLLEELVGRRAASLEKVQGDPELAKAIEQVEKKYGLAEVSATLAGQAAPGASLASAVSGLHQQLLGLVHERGPKVAPDPDVLAVLKALFRLRGSELAGGLGSQTRAGVLLAASSRQGGGGGPGMRGGPPFFGGFGGGAELEPLYGEMAKALAPLWAVCLEHPALERFAAVEAHLFPSALVLPALEKALAATPKTDVAGTRRLTAALAACGQAQAQKDIRALIDQATDDTAWLQQVASLYAYAGKPLGLYAMAKLVESGASRSTGGGMRGFRGGGGGYTRQLLELCGRSEALSAAMDEVREGLTEDEKKDQGASRRKVQDAYQERSDLLAHEAVQWVYQKYLRLSWDPEGRKFVAK